MKRVLLLMTTHTYRSNAFLDAVRALYLTATVGSERPQALSFANPAGHLVLDFGDPAASVRTIVEFAQRHPVDAIVATDDEGAIVAAAAANRLGLVHASEPAVRAARDKFAMRHALARAGFLAPWFARFPVDVEPRAISGTVPYPCVLKPTTLSASRGVIRAD